MKKLLVTLSAGSLLLLFLAGYLAWSTNAEMERTVTLLFGREQLLLARKVAKDIQNQLQFLRGSLETTAALWNGPEGRAEEPGLSPLFSLLFHWNVAAIGRMTPEGRIDLVTPQGPRTAQARDLSPELAALPADGPVGKGGAATLLLPGFIPQSGPFAGMRIMLLAARGQSGDVCFFVLDPLAIAQRHARDVRSGQTGYAWVIDRDAVFLSHYEDSFLGKDSLTVRSRRNPSISYEKINRLVNERLLRGEEGMDTYVSGWHREKVGEEITKHLAYSPVYLDPADNSSLWSVGITAPTEEVYGMVQPVLMRQGLIIGAIAFSVIGGLGVLFYLAARWSGNLEREVEKKTQDLKRSEAETRAQHDMVRESLDKLLKAQEQLVRAERFAAIGEAAAQLSHEIRNPLMIIGGFAAKLKRDKPEGSPEYEKLGIIEGETRRLEGLLGEMRDFTRPTKPQFQEADLNAVVGEVARLMADDLGLKGIACRVDLDPELPPFAFDPMQIKQVLINLVKNAREAMDNGGGTVAIRTWRENGTARVAVADTGEGIGPECLGKIFNPFFTTKCRGTGLGLTVSYRIMEDHGGRIEVASTLGEGSRFTLTFPLRQVPAQAADSPAEAAAATA